MKRRLFWTVSASLGLALALLNAVVLAYNYQGSRELAQRKIVEALSAPTRENLREALQAGMSLHASDAYGNTPLIAAARADDPALVQKLLAAGADPHAAQKTGATALHFAAALGHPEVTRLLVDSGCDVHTRVASQWSVCIASQWRISGRASGTPLDMAVSLRDTLRKHQQSTEDMRSVYLSLHRRAPTPALLKERPEWASPIARAEEVIRILEAAERSR